MELRGPCCSSEPRSARLSSARSGSQYFVAPEAVPRASGGCDASGCQVTPLARRYSPAVDIYTLGLVCLACHGGTPFPSLFPSSPSGGMGVPDRWPVVRAGQSPCTGRVAPGPLPPFHRDGFCSGHRALAWLPPAVGGLSQLVFAMWLSAMRLRRIPPPSHEAMRSWLDDRRGVVNGSPQQRQLPGAQVSTCFLYLSLQPRLVQDAIFF